MDEKTGRKRLKGEERKKQIIDHAMKLISEKGFKSVSMRDIAHSAGVNEALLYKHFTNKESLLHAVITTIITRRPAFSLEIPQNEKQFEDRLRQYQQFFLQLNTDNPGILKIMLYAVMEGYNLPREYDLNQEGTFLNWLSRCIEKGKQDWGYDRSVDNVKAISIFVGGLLYYIIQTSILKTCEPAITDPDNSFTRLFFKCLK